MISLSKSGNTVTFTFDENSGYLQNGTIDVPVNSLSLILDESNMATFRKSASNDIFVSANVGDFGMSKSELEAWYKENMVGSTGGGGTVSSAITSGDTNAVAGGAVYDQVTIGGGMEEISSVTISSSYSSVVMPDCNKFTISASTAIGDAITNAGRTINVYDKSTETLVFSAATVSNMNSNYVTVEGTTADTSIAFTAVDGYYFKGDNSMMFKSNYSGGWVVTFYKSSDVEWLKNVVSANTVAIEGKQDRVSISAGTGTNSIKENNASIANGNYSHAEGLNTSANTQASHAEGGYTQANGNYSHAEGNATSATSNASHAEGNRTLANGIGSHAEGYYTQANNFYEHASGQFNVSSSASTTFGDSGNTLFSVGNGTANNARHNAFEIRQNGDIYIASGSTDIKLQDHLGGGSGGNATVELTQSEYDALVSAGTVASDTYYIITDASPIYTTSAVTSGSTAVVESGGVYTQMGGLKLQQITQSAYDDLVNGGTVDNSTIYYIVN